ncbi:MAG: hypothetical protein K1X74_19770 [Pirellulales bacterium]|nr:hypothetical protein [Pirellulales bacterium]
MSVSGTAFLVDWDEFLKQFDQGGGSELAPILEPYFDAPPTNWIERYEPQDWNDNWHATSEASELYDAMRAHLVEPVRQRLDEFCSTFFWYETTGVRSDAGALPDGFALSPLSVATALGAFQRLTRDDYRAAFEHVERPPPDQCWFGTLDEIEKYFTMFARLLMAAARRERGVVVFVA